MNYALGKQLEEAGFPQGGKGSWLLPPDSLVARRNDRVYEPTLEELIEACGKNFTVLVKGLDGWYADSERGSTPTDAVAHLWLALNRKV